jgi:tetratricopeptide (TPR) repeat protein
LEASGIRGALISLGNDFITAVSLGITSAGASSLFNGTDKLLIADDEVWIPLDMSGLSQGFTAAWDQGVNRLNCAFGGNENVEFVVLEDAWAIYPPAPLPNQGIQFTAPSEAVIAAAVNTAIRAYIVQELQPSIVSLNEELRRAPSAGLYNRLGLLYMRAGQTAEAKTSFERAAASGSTAAMNNRGNMALNEGDTRTAEQWFRRVLAAEPENAAALRGLDRSKQ